ncbi:MAG: fructose-bisphosphatase class III [Gemmataceae bacterium]|nr:fructose-bisphosphatase class III [Gemmataceae bacterium]
MAKTCEVPFSPEEITSLRPWGQLHPTVDGTLAEIARLQALLTLPKGTIHIISDIHGEDKKLRHVINNASGKLRPLVEELFGKTLPAKDLQEFLTLIFYPREKLASLAERFNNPDILREFCHANLKNLFILLRVLAKRYGLEKIYGIFPVDYRYLFTEMLFEPSADRGNEYYSVLIDSILENGNGPELIHLTVRAVRNLAIDELIIAGDCWDRGARGDKVVDYMMKQPNISFTWGNHDAAWLGACLGNEALIAHVLRISLRYRNLTQLEEGYGIPLQPLEFLTRMVYANDKAECYRPKGEGLRDPVVMARMQKAAAVMQYKLEGQMLARRPEWNLAHRRLLHQIDFKNGTVTIEGKTFPLKDTNFPTMSPADPYSLSKEERECLDRLKTSFLSSDKLYQHMRYLRDRGSLYLVRDDHVIIHGCLPVDAAGEFLAFPISGVERKGKALFDALNDLIAKAIEKPSLYDLDMMWYLWCGPTSPLFGKDRIATFEIDLVEDPATHVENKNAFFQLIHEVPFCDKILREFGASTERGLIVNGHIPVKISQGESPLKRSGKAITIDGAFSRVYGDHGYTLILEPEGTYLAKHYHFESVEAAVREGVDIIPSVTEIRKWPEPRKVAETETGSEIQRKITILKRLALAYRKNLLRQPHRE